MRWLVGRVPAKNLVFRASDNRVIRDAILEGVGIGALTCWEAERYPNLVKLFEPQPEWSAPLWMVTHVDLHRTTKVQAFLSFLKEDAKSW
jgi:DNA-binding transcriptional LysR family regulator